MQNLKEELITVESSETALLDGIKKRKWWQGSLIPASDLSNCLEDKGVDWWVIATQPCNIYNPDFHKVPVFEVVAACVIAECLPRMTKGDDPRILHLEVQADNEIKALQIDIQKRKWLPRHLLAKLSAPKFHIRDTQHNIDANWSKKNWLDNFVGWMARSYTRIALPGEFNMALKKSRIEGIFLEKLTKFHEQLYGIYLTVDPDSDDEWSGRLGDMPPPYLLEIMLVTYDNADPESLKEKLIEHLFVNKVDDPDDKDKKLTRAELANRYQIRIIKQAISAKTMTGVNLLELKRYVRYSFVDHLSNSSVATGD